eukprot:TRINITY_DN47034_c0_g1_i1.p1 TRINITY_DN47034_c0_g1~~TRINITY_DN47034_c0_g1_i1.p1  ORF type:complete len:491 (+),score=185.37 TRINITY_DN47034_c0_g1_i1:100-1572(+)
MAAPQDAEPRTQVEADAAASHSQAAAAGAVEDFKEEQAAEVAALGDEMQQRAGELVDSVMEFFSTRLLLKRYRRVADPETGLFPELPSEVLECEAAFRGLATTAAIVTLQGEELDAVDWADICEDFSAGWLECCHWISPKKLREFFAERLGAQWCNESQVAPEKERPPRDLKWYKNPEGCRPAQPCVCSVCGVVCNSLAQYRAHAQGLKHRQAARTQQQNGGEPPEPMPCSSAQDPLSPQLSAAGCPSDDSAAAEGKRQQKQQKQAQQQLPLMPPMPPCFAPYGMWMMGFPAPTPEMVAEWNACWASMTAAAAANHAYQFMQQKQHEQMQQQMSEFPEQQMQAGEQGGAQREGELHGESFQEYIAEGSGSYSEESMAGYSAQQPGFTESYDWGYNYDFEPASVLPEPCPSPEPAESRPGGRRCHDPYATGETFKVTPLHTQQSEASESGSECGLTEGGSSGAQAPSPPPSGCCSPAPVPDLTDLMSYDAL